MELEAKYLIDSPERTSEVIALLEARGYQVRPAPTKAISDRYFDTAHWRLARQGWAFRIRTLATGKVLTLKSLGHTDDALHEREEIEQAIGSGPTDLQNLPAGPVREKLDALRGKRRRELVESFRIENQRQLHLARSEQSAAEFEIASDQVSIRSSGGRLAFNELELELLEGSRQALEELAAAISAELQLRPARQSKFERGLGLIGARPHRAARAKVGGDQSLAEFAYAVLREYFDDFLVEEPRAWEGLDPQGVHQAGVATRRLRAALRVFRDMLPDQGSEEFRKELHWLASALAEVRDLDFCCEDLDAYLSGPGVESSACLASYRAGLDEQRCAAHSSLHAVLGSARFRQMVDRFAAFLERGPSEEVLAAAGSAGGSPLRKAARRRVRKEVGKFRKYSRAITESSSDEELDLLQSRGEKLRGVLEIFRRVPGVKVGGCLRALSELQDLLAEYQDARVTIERLQGFAECLPLTDDSRETLFALGRLAGIQQMISELSRTALESVLDGFRS